MAIENIIYVHTIYVSYTVCVSWINKSSDVDLQTSNFDIWLYSYALDDFSFV